jgi:hypothetical protein
MKWVWAALFVAVCAGGVVGSFEFFKVRFSCAILKDIDSKTCGLGVWVNSFAWRTMRVVSLRVGLTSMSATSKAPDCQTQSIAKRS